MFLKCTAKNALAGKTGFITDIFGGERGIFQKVFCGGNARVYQVLMGSQSDFLFEYADKMPGA